MTVRCAVDIEEVKLAMESSLDEATAYLDTVTGRVVYQTPDIVYELEDLPHDADADKLRTLLADKGEAEREHYILHHHILYGNNDDERFREIDPMPSRWAYQDMEEFTQAIENNVLRGKLEEALDGRGAFRRFKTVLLDYPDARDRWFAFKDAKMTHRVEAWLEKQDIERIILNDKGTDS